MKPGTPAGLRYVAEQLTEDAEGCWGIRRKLNLRAAVIHLEATATILEKGLAPRTQRSNLRTRITHRSSQLWRRTFSAFFSATSPGRFENAS